MDCEPLTAREPDQPPLPLQELALLEFQVRVAAPPLAIVAGLALKLTTGAGAPLTMTVAEELADPPAPVQTRL